MTTRRQMLAACLAAPFLPGLARGAVAAPDAVVWKSPTCGCCAAWVAHLRDAGFEVEARDVGQDRLNAIKAGHGITPRTASCHTAEIGGYVIEGHVPAADIRRLLDERPDALGLAVPGMPAGSPGMEMGGRVDPYATLLLSADGATEIFARHG